MAANKRDICLKVLKSRKMAYTKLDKWTWHVWGTMLLMQNSRLTVEVAATTFFETIDYYDNYGSIKIFDGCTCVLWKHKHSNTGLTIHQRHLLLKLCVQSCKLSMALVQFRFPFPP